MLQDHREDAVSPSIRIDDAVWDWLKGQARPFEDTPNSVLRRVAGLDALDTSSSEERKQPTREEGVVQRAATNDLAGLGRYVTGDRINRRFRLGAKHALYHKDGTFYERLARFPGILCDDAGFVRFGSEEQFRKDSRLGIGVKVNVRGGLHTHPRYERFPASKA